MPCLEGLVHLFQSGTPRHYDAMSRVETAELAHVSGAVFAGLVTTLRPDGDSASHGPATIDTRCLRRAIYEFGCVVIRGFIPKPDVELYAGIAERTFDTCRQMLQILKVPDNVPIHDITDLRLRRFVQNIRMGQLEQDYFDRLILGDSIYDVSDRRSDAAKFHPHLAWR